MIMNSYEEVIKSAKLMLSGMKANSDRMSRRGLGSVFTSNFEDVIDNVRILKEVNDSLASKLIEKTADLEETVRDLKKLCLEAEKIVKIEMEKEAWHEFGISGGSGKNADGEKPGTAVY